MWTKTVPAASHRPARRPFTGPGPRGFSLVELMLAFAVVAVLLSLAATFYQRARREQGAVAFAQDMGDLVARVREQYRARTDYIGLTTNTLRTDLLSPPSMRDAVGRAVTPNGQVIQVNAQDVLADGTSGGFRVAIPDAGLTVDQCHSLLQRFSGDFVRLERNGVAPVTAGARMTPANYVTVRDAICVLPSLDVRNGALLMDFL